MNKIMLAAAITALFGCSVMAEVVENGDFSKGLAYWNIAIPAEYGGPPPTMQISGNALEFGLLHEVKYGYMTLNQAVNIKKGKLYKLTFEARGEGGGDFLVTIQDPGKLAHFSKLITPAASWEKIEIAITGLFDTDAKWVRDWCKATSKCDLVDGRFVQGDWRNYREPKNRKEPSCSYLTFGLGALNGSFAIRNISIVEVPPGK